MSRTILITENQLKSLTQSIKLKSVIQEDYVADLEKRMQAANKQSQINKTKCPTGYKQLTQKEVSSYTQTIKPWRDTRRGDKAFIQLPNGIVCQSFRSEKYTEVKKITLDQIVEAARNGLNSSYGLAIQVLLEFIPGIGQMINSGVWSLLLGYDAVYKGIMNNKYNWFNIIIDLIGVLTTGLGVPQVKRALTPLSNYAKQGLKSFVSAIYKKAPKIFNYIKGLLPKISSVVNIVTKFFSNFLTVIQKKIKSGVLVQTLTKLKNSLGRLNTFFDDMIKYFTSYGKASAEDRIVNTGVERSVGKT